MATDVWFIPGFMGSTLGLYQTSGVGGGRPQKLASLWGNLQGLPALPYVQMLALPAALPAGQVILADGIAPSVLGGYTDFLTWLSNNLLPGWSVAAWAYDWRLSARALGRALATALEANAAAGNTNVIVAHSQGALVAWSAWAALVDDGQTAALTRLTTFGGALYGTNSTPSLFREQEASLGQIAVLQQVFSAFPANAFGTFIAGPTDSQVAALLTLVASWPAVYDLYPDYHNLDDPKDLNRRDLFDASFWSAALVQPNFGLMLTEIQQVHEYVRQTKYVIPPSVVNHIVGFNHATSNQVQKAYDSSSAGQVFGLPPLQGTPATVERLRRLPWWSSTNNGDGRCTQAQQSFPGTYTQPVSSQHADMQDDPAVRELVAAMIRMTNPTPPVTPPLQVVAAWVPPSAVPSAPAYIFNNDPINTSPPRPVLPVRVGADP